MTEFWQGFNLGMLVIAVGKKDRETRAQIEANAEPFRGTCRLLVQAMAANDRKAVDRYAAMLGLKRKDGQLLYQAAIELLRDCAERERVDLVANRVQSAKKLMKPSEFTDWLSAEAEKLKESQNVVKLPEKESA